MAQVRVQKFLTEASDMARWQAGTVVLPQLPQLNAAPVEKERFNDRHVAHVETYSMSQTYKEKNTKRCCLDEVNVQYLMH